MRDDVFVECKILEVGEIFYCYWAKVFEVFDVDVVWSCGVVVFAFFDGLEDLM